MTRRRRSPAKTTSRKRLAGRNSTTRRSAASNARSGSGWSTGRNCGRSGVPNDGDHRFSTDHRLPFPMSSRTRAMNKPLDDAILQVRTLPEEQQREAAQLLFEFLELQRSEIHLAPEQIAEIERRLSDDEPYATDEDVQEVFARLTK